MARQVPANQAVLMKPRTRETVKFEHLTTIPSGRLIPFRSTSLVLPGDTIEFDLNAMVKAVPMTNPIIGHLQFCLYAFFVPHRIVWNNFKEFFGENNTSAWTGSYTKTLPVCGWKGSDVSAAGIGHRLGDYFGLPYYTANTTLQLSIALEGRAYAAIWNEYFRNQNLQSPIVFSKNDIGTYNGDTVLMNMFHALPLSVNRVKDVFSGLLPNPLKLGSAASPEMVKIPLSGNVPVVTSSTSNTYASGSVTPLKWLNSSSGHAAINAGTLGIGSGGTQLSNTTAATGTAAVPANLVADLSASQATIQDFRIAAAYDQFYRTLANNGSKYYEVTESMQGVRPSDARLDLPEFIAGFEQDLNINTVTATAGGSFNEPGNQQATLQPLGTEAGKSITFINRPVGTYHASEHGTFMIVGFIRQKEHFYANRIDGRFLMTDLFDQYFPIFAGTGDVPMYKSEVAVIPGSESGSLGTSSTVATISNIKSAGVVGYQEYGFRYRWPINMATGQFSPYLPAAISLKSWTMTDYFGSQPSLSGSLVAENANFIDRAFISYAPSYDEDAKVYSDPWWIDFKTVETWTRVMPAHNIIGMDVI